MEHLDNTYKAVISKLELMQEYFTLLDPLLVPSDEEILADTTLKAAIERYFQLIVDAAIDINTAIIQKAQLQPSADYQGTFALMGQCGALPKDLAFVIAPSVGLRNGLIHSYEKLDPARVIHDIKRNIGQYREYIKYILEYVERGDKE